MKWEKTMNRSYLYRGQIEGHLGVGKYAVFALGFDRDDKKMDLRNFLVVVHLKGQRGHGAHFVKRRKFNPKSYRKIDGLQCMLDEAYSRAHSDWLDQQKDIKGTVSWFDKSGGDGAIDSELGYFHFYGCNVKGANNGYKEYVDNVHLDEGDKVTFNLMSPIGAVDVRPDRKDAVTCNDICKVCEKKIESIDELELVFVPFIYYKAHKKCLKNREAA